MRRTRNLDRSDNSRVENKPLETGYNDSLMKILTFYGCTHVNHSNSNLQEFVPQYFGCKTNPPIRKIFIDGICFCCGTPQRVIQNCGLNHLPGLQNSCPCVFGRSLFAAITNPQKWRNTCIYLLLFKQPLLADFCTISRLLRMSRSRCPCKFHDTHFSSVKCNYMPQTP